MNMLGRSEKAATQRHSRKPIIAAIYCLFLCLQTISGAGADTYKSTPKSSERTNNRLKPYALLYVPPPALLRQQANYKASTAPTAENQFYFACHLLIAYHEIDKATKFARKAIVDHPTWCAPYLILGNIAELSFEDQPATEFYKKAIEAAPNCLHGYYCLADHLRRCTNYQGSLQAIQKGLALVGPNPTDDIRHIACNLYTVQSMNYSALKQYKSAVKSLEASDGLYPGLNTRRTNLADALLDDKQYSKVIDLSSKVLKQQPQFLEFYNLRALAYAATNQNQEAIADLNKFIARHHSTISIVSEDRKARTLRASLYEKIGNLKLAKIDRDFLNKEQLDAYKDTTFAGK